MKTLTYTLQIEPAEEGGYTVFFPALPGCMTQGETYEEALKNAEEALLGFIAALQKNGEKIPLEKVVSPVSVGLVVNVPVTA